MERVGALINKLKEQLDQQSDAAKMAVTAQLLLAELQQQSVRPAVAGKVSVVLPFVATARVIETEPAAEAIVIAAKEENPNWLHETPSGIPTLVHQPEEIRQPAAEVKREMPKGVEIQQPVFEFNTALADQGESLNERLREERVEVAAALQGTPIRDLKKAIGINDRFLFVNDLFRGDENMYERSIKTINGFTIYAEAEYWIQRELKVKLSWPDGSDTVRLFDQLIRRRFS